MQVLVLFGQLFGCNLGSNKTSRRLAVMDTRRLLLLVCYIPENCSNSNIRI